MIRLQAPLMALSLMLSLIPCTAHAGLEEGIAAHNKKDYATALREFKLLASKGDADAQNNIGVMYDKGQGVPQDYKEAVKWFRLAANQGNASAQLNLAVSYDNGLGIPQNYEEAVKWYKLAADQEHAIAQHYLGLMYSNGKGVPQSRVLAYALCNLSTSVDASSKNTAFANRETLAKSMSNAEIEAAQALTRELAIPNNFLKALDQYAEKSTVKEKASAN